MAPDTERRGLKFRCHANDCPPLVFAVRCDSLSPVAADEESRRGKKSGPPGEMPSSKDRAGRGRMQGKWETVPKVFRARYNKAFYPAFLIT